MEAKYEAEAFFGTFLAENEGIWEAARRELAEIIAGE